MSPRWERFWLGKPGKYKAQVRAQGRRRALMWGAFIYLLIDLILVIAIQRYYWLGATISASAVATFIGQYIPYSLVKQRQSATSPDQ